MSKEWRVSHKTGSQGVYVLAEDAEQAVKLALRQVKGKYPHWNKETVNVKFWRETEW